MRPHLLKGWRWFGVDSAGLGVCAVLTVLCYAVLIRPIVQDRSEARDRHHVIEAKSRQVEDLRLARQQFKKRAVRLEQELKGRPLRLQTAAQTNRRLSELTQLASQNGLQIDEVEAGTQSRGRFYTVIPIRLAGTGTYRTSATFLHKLHEDFSDTAVASFDLAVDGSDIEGIAHFQFELIWFTSSSEPEKPT